MKSKERLAQIAEERAKREAEKKAAEEAKQLAAEAKKAIKEGKLPPNTGPVVNGVNPQRQALIKNIQSYQQGPNYPQGADAAPKVKRMSKKQQKKLEALAPKPVPLKPVIPDGYSLPKEEEDFIALWDITDEGIQQRLIEQKRQKGFERRNLRNRQREQKKINRAVKVLKKQAANQGIMFDKKAAIKEVMAQREATLAARNKAKSNSGDDAESDSSAQSDSDSDSDSEVEEEVTEPVKVEKRSKKGSKEETTEEPEATAQTSELKSDRDSKNSRKSKRSADEITEDEPKPKKSKKSKAEMDEVAEDKPKSKKSKKSKSLADEVAENEPKSQKDKKFKESKFEDAAAVEKQKIEVVEAVDEQEVDEEAARKEKKRLKKEKKRQQELAKTEEPIASDGRTSNKRKRSKDHEENADAVEDGNREKKHKKKAKVEEEAKNGHSNGAEQWNPDALTGDAARKEKFLRLLGAGKSNGHASKYKSSPTTKVTNISKVQDDLEKQYEAGMKLKHDGGSKRRGLGA